MLQAPMAPTRHRGAQRSTHRCADEPCRRIGARQAQCGSSTTSLTLERTCIRWPRSRRSRFPSECRRPREAGILLGVRKWLRINLLADHQRFPIEMRRFRRAFERPHDGRWLRRQCVRSESSYAVRRTPPTCGGHCFAFDFVFDFAFAREVGAACPMASSRFCIAFGLMSSIRV